MVARNRPEGGAEVAITLSLAAITLQVPTRRPSVDADRLLLIVEDDAAFAPRWRARSERRGYQVLQHAEGTRAWKNRWPCRHAAMLAGGDSALASTTSACAPARAQPMVRIVVLTGFASIATAVEAIKLGAGHYRQTANTDDIKAALCPCRKANPR